MVDYFSLWIYLQDLGKILESMKGIDNIVAVIALIIAFYAIVMLKKSNNETNQVIREAIVVIKDQMIDHKTTLNNLQSGFSMIANITEHSAQDLAGMRESCNRIETNIAVLKDRSDV